MSMGHLLSCSLLCADCGSVDIEFHRGKGLEKRLDDLHIDWISVNVLADRNMILLTQIVAEVACPAFVLHHHLVSAFPTIDNAMQQSSAITRHPTRFVAIIGCIIVQEH